MKKGYADYQIVISIAILAIGLLIGSYFYFKPENVVDIPADQDKILILGKLGNGAMLGIDITEGRYDDKTGISRFLVIQIYPPGSPATEIVTRTEIDCRNETIRILSLAALNEEKILDSEDYKNPSWIPIVKNPDEINAPEFIMGKVCPPTSKTTLSSKTTL